MLPEITDSPQGRSVAMYDRGNTNVYACKYDPRFCYTLYVPEDLRPGDAPDLIVSVHGSSRTMWQCRDSFSEFGKYHNCVILAPLFPVGVRGDGHNNGYKYILEGDIRYDLVLLAMVAEVEDRLGVSFPKFMMCGYSGGGHFTHRFMLLHPERLSAAGIGAPGSVTLLDADRDWWVGVRNMREMFGKDLDLGALRQVEVLMTVGSADTETWEITHKPGSKHWMEGANDAGTTRIERNNSLRKSLEDHGLSVTQKIVPGMSHSSVGQLPYVKDFFRNHMLRKRAAEAGA